MRYIRDPKAVFHSAGGNLFRNQFFTHIGFTFDELYYSNDGFHIAIQGDFTSAITYEVLYVGECVGEKLTQRFKAHHALQDMLIEEKVISPSFDKSEELIYSFRLQELIEIE